VAKQKAGYKPEVTVRESEPKTEVRGKDMVVLCPFCMPPHPIAVGKESACGTALLVKAVQVIYPKRTVNKRGLTCLKCHQGGGEMVKFNLGFVHLHECTPGTRLMAEAPEFSKWAQMVYGMPQWMQKIVEARVGKARLVKEVDPEGKETGVILGYFFYRSPMRDRPNGGSNAAT